MQPIYLLAMSFSLEPNPPPFLQLVSTNFNTPQILMSNGISHAKGGPIESHYGH